MTLFLVATPLFQPDATRLESFARAEITVNVYVCEISESLRSKHSLCWNVSNGCKLYTLNSFVLSPLARPIR